MSSARVDATQYERWAEANFRTVLDAMPDSIVVVDAGGRIVWSNARTYGAFGYAHGELVGCDVEMLLPERFRGRHAVHCADFFAAPRVRSFGERLDLCGLRKDGSEFPVEIGLNPIPTEVGMMVSGIIRDVSERKRIEQSLLDKSVQVENASRAKDRFLAGMSHDLRTPLNAIVGFTGTLLMRLPGPLTAAQEDQLKTVQSSARHLVSLINDMLDVARIDAEEIPVRREWFDCREMIAELAAGLRPALDAKGLLLGMPDAKTAVMVCTDRQILGQILARLLENAIKFTDSGTVSIRVEPVSPTEVEITVSDTGAGIDAGTGRGLHLSSKLAGLLGASLNRAGAPAGGSIFTLRLEEP